MLTTLVYLLLDAKENQRMIEPPTRRKERFGLNEV